MAKRPLDSDDPVTRNMRDGHARQRSRIAGEAGGIGGGSGFELGGRAAESALTRRSPAAEPSKYSADVAGLEAMLKDTQRFIERTEEIIREAEDPGKASRTSPKRR